MRGAKQFFHLCLCQPNSFILKTNINLRFTVPGLINDYIAFLFFCRQICIHYFSSLT